MRKQVAYDFRLLKVSATDPGASRAQLDELVNSYLKDGWEILSAETVHYESNDAFVSYHFVKYVDESLVPSENKPKAVK